MSGGFVGRAAELRAILHELDLARPGGSRVVLVTGGAGVGKTRLLAELQRRVTTQAAWLAGRGSPLATALPYAAMVEAVESHLAHVPGRLREAGGPHATLSGHLPSLGGTAPAEVSPVAVFGAFRALFLDIARRRPGGALIVAIDDNHQADRSTWDLIGYLARNPLPAPVLFVVVCRTEAIAADLALAQWVDSLVKDVLAHEIALPPLTPDEIAELAAQTVGPAPMTAEVVAWLVDRSRGNALYATALLEDYAADPLRRSVPAGVRERVRLVLAGLPAEARAVLEAAAVLGHPSDEQTIMALVPGVSAEWLDDLTRRGLLVEPTPARGGTYDFAHPLVQEAVYDGLGAVRRRALHRRAVDALSDSPSAVLAYHAARGALPGDDAAIELILAAARDAEAEQVHRQAVALLGSALSLLRRDDDRRPVLDELAWQAGCIGDHLVGIPALRELERIVSDDAGAGAGIQMRLASFLAWGEGDVPAARIAAERAVQLLTGSTADEQSAATVNELAWVLGAAGALDEQITTGRAALEAAQACGAEEKVMHALGTVGHALALVGTDREALSALHAGRDIAVRRGDAAQEEWFTAVLIEAHIGFGALLEADDLFQRYAKSGRSPVDLLPSRQGLLAWYRGRWNEAAAVCDAAQALHPVAQPIHSAWSLPLGAVIAICSGRTAQARSLLAQGDRIYQRRRIYWMSARHEWLFGLAAMLSGDLDQAVVRLTEAGDWARAMGAEAVEGEVLPDLVEVLVLRGDAVTAMSYAERVHELARRSDSALWSGQSHYCRGLVLTVESTPVAAAQAFVAAAESFETAGAPFLAARAWEHTAMTTDTTLGVDALTAAARLYHECGASSCEQRIRAAMRARGRRGQQSARTVGDLTKREKDVLTLARSSLTTKQIAERLHIGERTVETHLANLYRKLGVGGRRELLNSPDATPT